MYDVILFDLDGTISDSAFGIINSISYALEKFNIEVQERSELYKFVGPPLQDSFIKYYNFNQEECDKAVYYFREYFKKQGMYENILYDGVEQLVRTLHDKGKCVMLATSKPEEFAIEILNYFHIAQYFDYIAGATMDGARRSKRDIITYALQQKKISDLTSVVMIGDRAHDIWGAKEVGIDSVGVLYGYGNRAELHEAGATYIAERVEDIIKYI